MSATKSSRGARIRDAERTRKAILDASERLFAARGYERTSLEEIGREAGLSRGTPSYFFRSKEGLYLAVLERILDARNAEQTEHFERALARLPDPPAAPTEAELRTVLEEVVDGYVQFFVERPTVVRLLQRVAIDGAPSSAVVKAPSAPLAKMLTTLLRRVAPERASAGEINQMILTFIGLLFFPQAQVDTMVASLGFDARDPRFLRDRKRHVVDLLLGWIQPERERPERG